MSSDGCSSLLSSDLWVFCHLLGIASDGLKGRVYEVSLADLQNDEVAFRKFKLIAEDVQGKNCLTNFHGMDLTRDKMCSMVKKWQVGRVLQRPAWYDAGLQFNFSAVGDLLPYWCAVSTVVFSHVIFNKLKVESTQ